MIEEIEWQIPPSMTRWIKEVPIDRPVVLLLRHSVRKNLPPEELDDELPITPTGRKLAEALGAFFSGWLRTLRASPLIRCIQTAEALREGSGNYLPITADRLLGAPGIYVENADVAWLNWLKLGHQGVMKHLVSSPDALPGMARPDQAARLLVRKMFSIAGNESGIHVFVTHDSLVTATVAQGFGVPLDVSDWPWYLEGVFFWKDDVGIRLAYREHHGTWQGKPLFL